jgi:GH15 family glucan-1,4-alpha-glucosidase
MLAEEYQPDLRRQVGNVPQTLSHASLVNAASRLFTLTNAPARA